MPHFRIISPAGTALLMAAFAIFAHMQFRDHQALGLTFRYTAANMRHTFDLRQVYLRFPGRSLLVQ